MQIDAASAAVHAKAVELGQHVLRMTSQAGSGHPSSGLAISHLVIELMYRQMRHDPANPLNPNNDRLVLSIGHAVPIIYAAWADLGGAVGAGDGKLRPLTVEDLWRLRDLESPLDGHPNPAEGFPFFDAATGSLGQGLSAAAGLAAAARLDNNPRRIFVLAGDGESREGQVWEAMDAIAERKLSNVCVIFSCNGQGQAGPVSPQQSAESLARKAEAFGWETVVIDGHDPAAIAAAFAKFGQGERPLAIVAQTVKGWGVPLMQASNYHGKPVAAAQLDEACKQLQETGRRIGAASGPLPRPAAPAPASVRGHRRVEIMPFSEGLRRVGLDAALAKKKLATRVAFGAALVALGDRDDQIVSLDGDVSNSTFSEMFAKFHAERFFECKIAEQNMVTMAVGMAAAGKVPFASSFAKFLTRAYDQVDMASITRANIKLVGSHAGVSLGADGPSQMAVSDLAYFRSFTRVDDGQGGIACTVFHPADAICAYRCTELMANIDGLCYMRTHRPEAPFLYNFNERFERRGCKQLRSGNRLTLVGSGYMLHTVLQAADRLVEKGLPCNVFDVYTLPLDAEPILAAARNRGGVVLVVEDNYAGGVHAELAEAAAQKGEVRVIGLTARRIPKSARTAEEVFSWVGVGIEHIMEQARRLIS